MRHVRPTIISAAEVSRQLARFYTCPFCGVESTSSVGNGDIGWVVTPLRRTGPRFICLGCCEDIYSTCASDSFADHPYRDIVEDAARKENCEPDEFRRICIQHQLEIIEERKQWEPHPEYDERQRSLKQLLQELEGSH